MLLCEFFMFNKQVSGTIYAAVVKAVVKAESTFSPHVRNNSLNTETGGTTSAVDSDRKE